MRLICKQHDLLTALSITNKAVGVNNTMQILNNVLLKTENGKLYFTGTNLEIAIHYSMDAEILEDGNITIPSKLLTSYVNFLKDEKVTLSLEEGDALLVKTSDSKTKIKGSPASEFPNIPVLEKEFSFSVSSKDLAGALSQVSFAASLSSTRPILTGVYFEVDGSRLVIAATDSYRLAERKVTLKESSGTFSCIVPVKTVLELGSIISGGQNDEVIEVIVSKNQIFFAFGKIKITSRLIEGQFPNYKQIIPSSVKTKVILNVSELSLALKRVSLFARENNNKILLKIDGGLLNVTTNVTQYGVGETEVKAKIDGENNEIALNSQFMLDVLSCLGSPEVVLEFGEKTHPAIFKPFNREDYIHIIMPLKI